MVGSEEMVLLNSPDKELPKLQRVVSIRGCAAASFANQARGSPHSSLWPNADLKVRATCNLPIAERDPVDRTSRQDVGPRHRLRPLIGTPLTRRRSSGHTSRNIKRLMSCRTLYTGILRECDPRFIHLPLRFKHK